MNLETGQCPTTISKLCFTEQLAQVPVEVLLAHHSACQAWKK